MSEDIHPPAQGAYLSKKCELDELHKAIERLEHELNVNGPEGEDVSFANDIKTVLLAVKKAPLSFTFCPRCGVQMNPKTDPSAKQ